MMPILGGTRGALDAPSHPPAQRLIAIQAHELLDPVSGLHLTSVEIPVGIESHVVDPIEIARLFSARTPGVDRRKLGTASPAHDVQVVLIPE